MGAWDYGLYGSDEALEARGTFITEIVLPEPPKQFAGCVGLLALLDPTARQLGGANGHSSFAALPQTLRDATAIAANVAASGPRLPYTDPVRDVLGVDASYGRVVDPLLELREAITVARLIRDRAMRIVERGFTPGNTAIGGIVGVLVELRELGIAISPDQVDAWLASFDHTCALERIEEGEFMREWARSYRTALDLLATPPEKKLLGSDPTRRPR